MIVNFDEFNNIPSVFYYQSNDLKDQPYLWKKENNKYVSLSWLQVKEQVESLATYLKDLGILEGDRVLILSENRPEWQITDLAIMSIGAISVPAYTTSTTNDYEYIIKNFNFSIPLKNLLMFSVIHQFPLIYPKLYLLHLVSNC